MLKFVLENVDVLVVEDRTFTVSVSDEAAKQMTREGWHVVNNVLQVTGDTGMRKVGTPPSRVFYEVEHQPIPSPDVKVIKKLVLSGYPWQVMNRSGIKAYLFSYEL